MSSTQAHVFTRSLGAAVDGTLEVISFFDIFGLSFLHNRRLPQAPDPGESRDPDCAQGTKHHTRLQGGHSKQLYTGVSVEERAESEFIFLVFLSFDGAIFFKGTEFIEL